MHSRREHKAWRGEKCPVCFSNGKKEQLSLTGPNYGKIHQSLKCSDCNHTYNNTYTLFGYTRVWDTNGMLIPTYNYRKYEVEREDNAV